MTSFSILLPTHAQIEAELSSEYKFDRASSHHVSDISVSCSKLRYISGVTQYEWTQADYDVPFKVYSLAKWTHYVEHDYWSFEVTDFKTLEELMEWSSEHLQLLVIKG